MLKNKSKKITAYCTLRGEKGQALLIVLVISTLTLLILIGLASRILSSRTNVRRSADFDQAILASENVINEIIKILQAGGQGCNFTKGDTFTRVEGCAAFEDLGVEVYSKKPEDNFVPLDYTKPVTLFTGTETTPKDVDQIKISCANISSDQPSSFNNSNVKIEVTQVYESAGRYKVLKGILPCPGMNPAKVTMYNEDANPTIRARTVAIQTRILDSNVPVSGLGVGIEAYNKGKLVASTGSFEFIASGSGVGGLGSDNLLKFRLPSGDTDNLPAFNFVYFGEN